MQSRIGGLMNTDIKKQLDSICNILDFHKGHAITTVDLSEQSVIADYFVIADGATAQQVKSMADYLEKGMDKLQLRPIRKEGYADGKWIVLDYGDIIVHLFRKEERDYFALERLWNTGRNLSEH